ncbi:zinc ribbon domain-containing protein [Nocardioides sp.]|uniref:zinc ribbon domain-containing protein n=1 Tax=Nocardioides sp. TaxID=35761 RepID=UPI002B265E34|nr:zinc ribbon domain-containing protein [Nocardioides sp.]
MAPSDQSSTARTVFRILGAVLVVGGLVLLVRGGTEFVAEMNGDTFGDDAGFGPILRIAGGGFLVVFGLAALNAGFLGAQSRYVSGETSDAVREFGSAFRGEPSQGTTRGSGPHCSSCGVQADREARFCDACGHALAPR